jgi:hypothetical protein
MPSNSKPRRKSIRLAEYDYSQEGAYFVTICTHDRKCLFGEVSNGRVGLNELGKIEAEEIEGTENQRPGMCTGPRTRMILIHAKKQKHSTFYCC